MKRVGNIYIKICDKDNIRKAIIFASQNKRKRKDVQKILNDLDRSVDKIYTILKDEIYEPSPYIKAEIYDGVKRKKRIIYKPKFFPDQIIHWCLMLQIEPILQKPMYYYSGASIKNKGVLFCSSYIKNILKKDCKNTKYCLKADIKKFFPNIDKEILKVKMRKRIKCESTLKLIDKIIDSCESGIPIGNYTSQWFANFYLDKLDHYIKENLHVKYYIRYMDDIVLFHRNKKELHKIFDKIVLFLKNEKLEIKSNWQVFKTDSRPLDFLGYKFYRNRIELRSNIALRIKRKVKRVYKKGFISTKDASALIAYYGWIKHSNSRNFYLKNVKTYINIKDCKKAIRNNCNIYIKE